mgnify:CR=1 FL=1
MIWPKLPSIWLFSSASNKHTAAAGRDKVPDSNLDLRSVSGDSPLLIAILQAVASSFSCWLNSGAPGVRRLIVPVIDQGYRQSGPLLFWHVVMRKRIDAALLASQRSGKVLGGIWSKIVYEIVGNHCAEV